MIDSTNIFNLAGSMPHVRSSEDSKYSSGVLNANIPKCILPVTFNSVENGYNYLTLSLLVGSGDRMLVDSVIVNYKGEDDDSWSVFTARAESGEQTVTLDSLEEGTEYEVVVTVTSMRGVVGTVVGIFETMAHVMYFETEVDNTIEMSNYSNPPSASLLYSRDNLNWTEWTGWATVGGKIIMRAGDRIYLRAKRSGNTAFGDHTNGTAWRFISSNDIYAHGNVMSLLDYRAKQTEVPDDGFYMLFSTMSTLKSAPDLSAIRIAGDYSMAMMFYRSGIVECPDLSNVSYFSTRSCYRMFYMCSVTQGCELRASTFGNGCFEEMYSRSSLEFSGVIINGKSYAGEHCLKGMFYGCSNLNDVYFGMRDWPEGQDATQDWLYGVAATGEIVCHRNIHEAGVVTDGSSSTIPNGWTVRNFL